MAATPARNVHWDTKDLSPSLLCSPAFEGSTESYISTSSLEYVNTQLIAHGFAPSPGLSLEGMSGTDSDRVVKCLLGMLSQRMEDMSRTEDLSTKLRTLTYEHERLLTMHRTAKERAANAEREMNVHKSKLTASIRTLQSTESAHKQTSAELQRARTSLQAIRATHQSELKKRDKDIDRMAEKWSKISDAQMKLMSVPAGIHCANIAVVEDSELRAKNPSSLEVALDEAEKARTQLIDETMRLRRLVLKVVNQMQTLLHQVRAFTSDKEEPPTPFTLTNLFPMQPPTHAHDSLTTILHGLRDCLTTLPQHIASASSLPTKLPGSDQQEIERLQDVISQLHKEIERSQKQSKAQAFETREFFNKSIADHQKTSKNTPEMNTDFMTVPMVDEERERLEKMKNELDDQREKFTQATIKLGKERAAFEAERNKLLDEKRSWQVQQMLTYLPPTPDPLPPSPHKSPRKTNHSPAKKSPWKTSRRHSAASSMRKTTRVSRRSSVTPNKPSVIPPYETELVLSQLPAPPPLPASFSNLKPTASILPSFVLPPPSPYASLPTNPILPLAAPISAPNFSGEDSPTQTTINTPPINTDDSTTPPDPTSSNPNLTTPVRRPFPMAKPFAQRMVHAYSPAKPSPLSRILLLAKSPNTPQENSNSTSDDGLEVVREEDENFDHLGPGMAGFETPKRMSLAAELGVESPPDIVEVIEVPLKEKKADANVNVDRRAGKAPSKPAIRRGAVVEDGRRVSSRYASGNEGLRDRTKFRSTSGTVPTEKENGIGVMASRRASTTAATASSTMRSVSSGRPTKPVIKPTVMGGITKAKAGPGPRRVPINSAEAPPIARRKS